MKKKFKLVLVLMLVLAFLAAPAYATWIRWPHNNDTGNLSPAITDGENFVSINKGFPDGFAMGEFSLQAGGVYTIELVVRIEYNPDYNFGEDDLYIYVEDAVSDEFELDRGSFIYTKSLIPLGDPGVTGSGNEIIWTLDNPADNETHILTYDITLKSGLAPGSYLFATNSPQARLFFNFLNTYATQPDDFTLAFPEPEVSVDVTSGITPPPPPTTNLLTVEVLGNGTANPMGGTAVSIGDWWQLVAEPADGWYFVGWQGTDGDDVTNANQIYIDGDKSLVAVFAETASPTVPTEPEPTEPEPTEPEPTEPTEPEVLPTEAEPTEPEAEDPPPLPKTGGVPPILFYGIGSLMTAAGIYIRKRSKEEKQEEES